MKTTSPKRYLHGTCRTCGKSFSYSAQSLDGRTLVERTECNACGWKKEGLKQFVPLQSETPGEIEKGIDDLWGKKKEEK